MSKWCLVGYLAAVDPTSFGGWVGDVLWGAVAAVLLMSLYNLITGRPLPTQRTTPTDQTPSKVRLGACCGVMVGASFSLMLVARQANLPTATYLLGIALAVLSVVPADLARNDSEALRPTGKTN